MRKRSYESRYTVVVFNRKLRSQTEKKSGLKGKKKVIAFLFRRRLALAACAHRATPVARSAPSLTTDATHASAKDASGNLKIATRFENNVLWPQ